MNWIIRCRDVIQLIKDADTLMELKRIKNALYDEEEVVMLSNKTVNYALELVNDKIKNMDKEKIIHEIIDLLF